MTFKHRSTDAQFGGMVVTTSDGQPAVSILPQNKAHILLRRDGVGKLPSFQNMPAAKPKSVPQAEAALISTHL